MTATEQCGRHYMEPREQCVNASKTTYQLWLNTELEPRPPQAVYPGQARPDLSWSGFEYAVFTKDTSRRVNSKPGTQNNNFWDVRQQKFYVAADSKTIGSKADTYHIESHTAKPINSGTGICAQVLRYNRVAGLLNHVWKQWRCTSFNKGFPHCLLFQSDVFPEHILLIFKAFKLGCLKCEPGRSSWDAEWQYCKYENDCVLALAAIACSSVRFKLGWWQFYPIWIAQRP